MIPEALEKFKRVMHDNPEISANSYDSLAAHDKPSRTALQKHYGVTWNGLKAIAGIEGVNKGGKPGKDIPPKDSGEKIFKSFSDTQGYIEITSRTIHTLPQALEASKTDLKKWEVERHTINFWTVTMKMHEPGEGSYPESRTNCQVKVWLKPKIPSPMDLAIRMLIKKIPKFKPRDRDREMRPEGEIALEMALYDAHMGKLAWGQETMQGDYDIKIAGEGMIQAAELNLNYASAFDVSKIFYIIGQDLMHAENFLGQTPMGGNILDVDSRLPKLYMETKAATLKILYMCREVAPVECLWVPGNHDMHGSFYLSEAIKEHFRKDKFVTVDNSPPWRKARLWGNLLVGYTHDATGRYTTVTVNMLPQFWPELWGQSKFREWHCGHKHKKQEMKFAPVTTSGGVVIRQIPALSLIDAWHFQEGYVDSVPAGESFIWTKDAGIIAHFTANVRGFGF